ncbi:hypothetical protein NIIDMKKI_76700 [Mycobacterium kansasii]|uniref:ParB-like N-terminal domain-containing protein n=1 Tax=Mycobacterium kansasii TaxID=1768 RepID=A0A7G1IQ44_MYCKA|nr:hypothetical protein NIIDMKKI_76700 [Mycobacterium kansasii]
MTQPSRRKGGLGRGLASLIPTGPADGESGPSFGPRMGSATADVVIGGPALDASPMGAVYREIAPSDIEANPRQPRQVFDQEALQELVHSIREFGLLQPIVVRAIEATPSGAHYQIVMGSDVGALPKRPAWPRFPLSCAKPVTIVCCAMPYWKTSIGSS